MKLIKHDLSSAIASFTPIMVGDVASQILVGELDAEHLRMSSVTFHDGARNRFHRHSCDQILIVLEGRGLVVTQEASIDIAAGDVIVVPADELHWHGAIEGHSMTHFSIVTPHETTVEEPINGSDNRVLAVAAQ